MKENHKPICSRFSSFSIDINANKISNLTISFPLTWKDMKGRKKVV